MIIKMTPIIEKNMGNGFKSSIVFVSTLLRLCRISIEAIENKIKPIPASMYFIPFIVRPPF